LSYDRSFGAFDNCGRNTKEVSVSWPFLPGPKVKAATFDIPGNINVELAAIHGPVDCLSRSVAT